MSAPRVATRPLDTGSRTVTVTATATEDRAGPSGSSNELRDAVGTLRLRGGPVRRQKVMWSEGTVDNEGMGKKKSKICCIYHRPKAFDESSSESSSESDSEDHDTKPESVKNPQKTQGTRQGKGPSTEVDSSESDGGAGDGRARPPRPKRHSHHHSHDCHHETGKQQRQAKANKYDQSETKG